jgi:threonine dehydrogenase-like Zn-dependent dehydrogenase
MRATLMYAAHDVRVTSACICGSDLWPYRAMERTDAGQGMGHEALGVVEAVGKSVTRVRAGDAVTIARYPSGTPSSETVRSDEREALKAMIAV